MKYIVGIQTKRHMPVTEQSFAKPLNGKYSQIAEAKNEEITVIKRHGRYTVHISVQL